MLQNTSAGALLLCDVCTVNNLNCLQHSLPTKHILSFFYMRLSTFEKHLGIKLHIFHTGIGLVRISLVGSTFTTLPKHKISPNINNFEYTFTVTYFNVINIFLA